MQKFSEEKKLLFLMDEFNVNLLNYECHNDRAFLAGRLPVMEAVSLSPYFKRNLPVFENNQFLNIKVYENDMRKNSLFSFTNFLGSA